MKTDAETVRDLRMRVKILEMEVREIHEETDRAREVFKGVLFHQQLALLLAISKRPVVTYEYLDNVTEEHGKYNRYEGEMHQTLRTKVAVWKLRQKLKPYGIEIKTWRRIGYYLDDENKAKLKALMEKKDD